MSDSVLMPALGESVTEGTVTRWLKQVGDTVEVDEPLLEVSTDKVDTEIPSPFAGTLLEILVQEDDTVEVGAALAVIGEGGESSGAGDGGAGASDGAASGDEQQAAQVPDEVTGGPVEEPDAAGGQGEPTQQAAAPQEEPKVAGGGQEAGGGDGASADEGASDEGASHQGTSDQGASDQGAAAQGGGAQGGGDTQDVALPALGESVTEGTVTRWLKQVGDSVEVDEALLEISTDKVDTEIPSPFAGTVTEILVQEDETVEVGTVLARVGSAGSAPAQQEQGTQEAPQQPAAEEEPSRDAVQQSAQDQQGGDYGGPGPETEAAPADDVQAPQPSAAAQEKPEQTLAPGQAADREQTPTSTAPAAPSSSTPTSGGYLTPLVRKLAAEKGVDLSTLSGTGVGGRIRKEDVLEAAARAEAERAERERAAAAPQAAPAAASAPARAAAEPAAVSPLRGTTEKASRLRQIIAERMVDALHSMAQLTTVVEVDVTRVAQLRARAKDDFKAREGVNLTYLPFFVLAATEALKAHPKVNGVLAGNQITYHGHENVGIAVDTERGLVVPVIRDAGDLNLAGIARKINDLATRTRDNKATPDELSGATFTVTNTGSGGALFDTPIVPGGTSAILGTGAIVKRPVVATDEFGTEFVAIRSMCYLALSYDHRLVDGADASRYLQTVKKRIEDGAFESEVGL
ncbi:2-oxoglutarate dehydrogenase, E2 component, dihydrolipoamide succinyltransferase [Actinotalea sp. Marseille-Q4924]|uniref:2-oxoglutarate dehydrogenase, E2 component, dihydrolipoamide succinyltransferase n=1 Tax=Actinotalea sp. Marseille-Q4924 TaxID=2866571 RepID=UPI001CE4AE48|nr:2-oxoglutarate dehydrogenase, E2 component, dihydrolipoamide succinyltransferase [Actinotalea sp. Marseille-Q4924]